MGCFMWSRLQYTYLTYMGGNGLYVPMSIIFSGIIQS